jgi:hypothetical protein
MARRKREFTTGGEPRHPSNRHPCSDQADPTDDGDYMVLGFPGDDPRVMQWSEGRFTMRGWLHAQRWWKWRPV